MPPHKRHVPQPRPVVREDAQSRRIPSIDDKRHQIGEGLVEAVSDEELVLVVELVVFGGEGLDLVEEGVAPGGEVGEVEVGDGGEGGGEEEEVAEVAAEGEGGAGGALDLAPLLGDEGGVVAGADVGDGGDYAG